MKGIVSLTLTAACLLALISCSKGSVPTTPDSLTPYRQATIFTDAEVIFEGTNVSEGYHDIDLATIQHVTGADPALLDFNAAAVTIERADFNSNGIIGKVRFRWLDSQREDR
jgi:hypothetical protein